MRNQSCLRLPRCLDLPSAFWIVGVVLSSFMLHPSSLAQGPLVPPGAPAPTMKTLQQVEPRTPISALPLTISQAGSYYLTTNLTGNPGGITIAASGVTLDLMGFELVGGTGSGIAVSGGTRTNICVRNGTVRNWTSHGLNVLTAINSQYHNLRVQGNSAKGIYAGEGCTVRDCNVWRNLDGGIAVGNSSTVIDSVANYNSQQGILAGLYSTVSRCTASHNQNVGIAVGSGSAVTGCAANDNTSGAGIQADRGCTVSDCSARGNGYGITVTAGSLVRNSSVSSNLFDGVQAGIGSTVQGCTARDNGNDGIQVANDCLVLENQSTANATSGFGAGIHATLPGNRIEGNVVIFNQYGLRVVDGANLIIRNSARFNTTNYEIAADNRYGPIINITAGGTAAVSGNSAAGVLTTTDPWANFSY